jgi:uncharacterized protein YdaU (DUF1376 family)
MTKAPAYVRFFASDWLAGTRELTMHETGVYITLVAMMYEKGEPIDGDVGRLSRLCGTTAAPLSNALKRLTASGKIIEMDGARLWNAKVEIELQQSEKITHAKRQSASQRWARANGEKPKENNEAEMRSQSGRNATDMHRARDSRTRAREEEKETPVGVSKKTKTGSRIPDDFEPDIAFAVSEGLPEAKANVEAKKFMDYWRAKPGQGGVKLDWLATWRNWCRKALEDYRKHSPPQTSFWKGDRI